MMVKSVFIDSLSLVNVYCLCVVVHLAIAHGAAWVVSDVTGARRAVSDVTEGHWNKEFVDRRIQTLQHSLYNSSRKGK